MNGQDVPVRDAATLILVRDPGGATPQVLMGQRGASAAFMPNKFVFPGGAVDAADADIKVAGAGIDPLRAGLAEASTPASAAALLACAIRELWEEAGLILGQPGTWEGEIPADWVSFAATGHVPSAAGFAFVFRAKTPFGRPRRFDARFLLVDARHLATDPDDFSRASDELSHLHWVPVGDARRYDLPFITQVVLAEVSARLPDLSPPRTVPYFRNDDEALHFDRLGGVSPLDRT